MINVSLNGSEGDFFLSQFSFNGIKIAPLLIKFNLDGIDFTSLQIQLISYHGSIQFLLLELTLDLRKKIIEIIKIPMEMYLKI